MISLLKLLKWSSHIRIFVKPSSSWSNLVPKYHSNTWATASLYLIPILKENLQDWRIWKVMYQFNSRAKFTLFIDKSTFCDKKNYWTILSVFPFNSVFCIFHVMHSCKNLNVSYIIDRFLHFVNNKIFAFFHIIYSRPRWMDYSLKWSNQ